MSIRLGVTTPVARLICRATLAFAGASAGACTSPESSAANSSATSVRIRSDVGDPVGLGRTYEYTQSNARVTVARTTLWLSMEIAGDEQWNVLLQPPAAIGARLAPGVYLNAKNYFVPGSPTVIVTSREHGCSSSDGQFTIESVAYGPDSLLSRIDGSFEQRCQGANGMLSGSIHWRSDDPTEPRGPVVPVPAGLWRPPVGSTPATGNYVYIASEAGDQIGQGKTNLYTNLAAYSVATNGGRIIVGDAGPWLGVLYTGKLFTDPTVGYWADLTYSPSYTNPTKGTIEWGAEGRRCNKYTGWFAIDAITFSSPRNMRTVDARFEQHCDGAAAALRGAIHVGP